MKAEQLIERIKRSRGYVELSECSVPSIRLSGVSGSLFSILLALESLRSGGVIVSVMENRDSASYLYNDLYNILELNAQQDRVMLLPTAYRRAITTEREDTAGIVQRTATLSALCTNSPLIICTWAEALAEKVVSEEKLKDNKLNIKRGQALDKAFVEEILVDYNFTQVEFVSSPGEFASRGGLLDIFSFADSRPYRVDFLGDEVDSIRVFSPSSQLSDGNVEEINIVPNLKDKELSGKKVSLAHYINSARSEQDKLCLWFNDIQQSLVTLDKLFEKLDGEQVTSSDELYADTLEWHYIVKSGTIPNRKNIKTLNFGATPQPSFARNFELFAGEIEKNFLQGVHSYLLTPNIDQWERLHRIISEVKKQSVEYIENIELTLHEGFVAPSLGMALYTDHQLFERYHRYKVHSEVERSEGMTLSEFTALRVGDFVVHIDHGIGRFGGLVRQRDENSGAVKEFIKLMYKDNDVLFVGVQNLHRISKYKSGDSIGEEPKLQKLGSSAWAKLKANTKRKVKDIARELIRLYAKRKMSDGFAFSPDSYLQQELEASFIYEDTPDQRSATDAIKADMENPQPMDRLVCGDVGFGKTEVAMRAAFKAATDGKQVAVLVPTTVLSLQHSRTFKRRLKNFPVEIRNLSRANTTKVTNEILRELSDGKVDIIIGTHKLLGKSVKFKDLGLLIIDEEQKFGVTVKEKLKELKHSVDTLTLTATPIPRTLQFSLMGARDMSIINTPPPNRRPVSTELHPYDDDIIREAVEYELSRGGQVFFLHNRVGSINQMARKIEDLVPGAKVGVGHGQMAASELEKVMMDFIYGEYNVLVATTIIESGIDIPNANTIIINNAQNFGLSDLHQLRGRVGRTNRKAYCYLLVPSFEALSTDSQRRLRAIEEFSDLGSGFNIAMQDLDIRGAGNILGAEQSGFMADIGYETYQKIVNEAMIELHDEMGAESGIVLPESSGTIDCTVETDTSAHLPDGYIGSTSEKIRLYRSLDKITNPAEIESFKEKLVDRFGELPKETIELLEVVLLRGDAARLGFDKVVLKGSRAKLTFAYSPQSAYYSSEIFGLILAHVARNPRNFNMRQGVKLSIEVSGVKSVAGLREMLRLR